MALSMETINTKIIKNFEEIIERSQNYNGKITQEQAANLLRENPHLKLIIRAKTASTSLSPTYPAYYVTSNLVEEGTIVITENGFKANFPNLDSSDTSITNIEALIFWLGIVCMPDSELRLQPKRRINL